MVGCRELSSGGAARDGCEDSVFCVYFENVRLDAEILLAVRT